MQSLFAFSLLSMGILLCLYGYRLIKPLASFLVFVYAFGQLRNYLSLWFAPETVLNQMLALTLSLLFSLSLYYIFAVAVFMVVALAVYQQSLLWFSGHSYSVVLFSLASAGFIAAAWPFIAIIASASLGTLAVGYAGLLLLGIIEADIALLDVRALFEHIATILAMNPLLLYGCLGVLGVVLLFSLGFQTKSYIAWNAKQQKGTSRN